MQAELKYGASRQAWRTMPTRTLAQKVVEDNPTMDQDALRREFVRLGREDQDVVDEALSRVFDNDFSGMQKQGKIGSDTKVVTRTVAGRTTVVSIPRTQAPPQRISQEAVRAGAERLSKIVLMNLVLPSGVCLKDATEKDCYAAGGWFVEIASRLEGTGKKVGQVLNEAEVQKIWKEQLKC